MELRCSFLGILQLILYVQCFDFESSEINNLETNPIHDTIIFRDIAEILNDYESNINSSPDAFVNSESEVDEDIEDLLSEYQHYLNRAYNQHRNYIEKSKTKNKVPLLRHEKFSKLTPIKEGKYDNKYYSQTYHNPEILQYPQTYNDPLDIFIPYNTKVKYGNQHDITTPTTKHVENPFETLINNEKSPLYSSIYKPIQSTCLCKIGQIPCDCKCKQCIIPLDPMLQKSKDIKNLRLQQGDKKAFSQDYVNDNASKSSEHMVLNDMSNMPVENTLNIRIKVNLQLENVQDKWMMNNYKNKNLGRSPFNEINSKELPHSVDFPLSYFNFPMPIDMFDNKRISKSNLHASTPFNKLIIHKKKKSKSHNNSNRKHRKKIITFHNIKLTPQQLLRTHFGEYNNSTSNKKDNNNTITVNSDVQSTTAEFLTSNSTNAPEKLNLNKTVTEKSIFLIVNISNNIENYTENRNKSENSIEVDDSNNIINVTTQSTRIKRNILSSNTSTQVNEENNNTVTLKTITKNTKLLLDKNKFNKDVNLLNNEELLYWPNKNNTKNGIHSKNITAIILESDKKKAKLNMSKETMRRNHTHVLEKAIFGEVDWNDVDSVAPAFMSFVGKYTTGVITFCSDKICHSMKCANKTCIHRICLTMDRVNNKGHCMGSNETDSIATLESIMDLPSNIAFEIVDILHDKMLGRLFGKATLCIGPKCVHFVAAKKTFITTKCTVKELNAKGHCQNT